MRKFLIFIFTILLCGNVAYGQDIERENRLNLIQEILKNPNDIYTIADTSSFIFPLSRKFWLDSSVLYKAAISVLDEFRVDGTVYHTFAKDSLFEMFSDGPKYLGIMTYHEITIQNLKQDRFLNFLFVKVANTWTLHTIGRYRNYFVGYGH